MANWEDCPRDHIFLCQGNLLGALGSCRSARTHVSANPACLKGEEDRCHNAPYAGLWKDATVAVQ